MSRMAVAEILTDQHFLLKMQWDFSGRLYLGLFHKPTDSPVSLLEQLLQIFFVIPENTRALDC